MKTWLWKLRDTGHKEGSLHVSKLQRQITRKEREFQCHWISLATVEAGGHRKPGNTGRFSSPWTGARTLCLKD